MKQLPGQQSRTLPRWLKTVMAGAITVIATIWLVSLLPFLLLAVLVLSIALIPITRRLRREIGMSAIESTKAARSRKGSNDTSQMVVITVTAPAMTVFSHRGRVLLC